MPFMIDSCVINVGDQGPWRWFHETMLDCCQPLEVVKRDGITFDQFVCLARCNGADLTAKRASHKTLAVFRTAVARTSSNRMTCSAHTREFLVVSYGRQALDQTGDGHFSPIGGYNARRDLVLILDVARHKYPPHWVPLPLLHKAMLLLDSATKMSRGFAIMRRCQEPSGSKFLFAITRQPDFSLLRDFFVNDLPQLACNDQAPADMVGLLKFLFERVPGGYNVLSTYERSIDISLCCFVCTLSICIHLRDWTGLASSSA